MTQITTPSDGIGFTLTAEQKMLQAMAREFTRNEIIPVAAQYDKNHEFPWPIIRKAQQLGLTVMTIPKIYGGSGLSMVEECIVTEELAYGCSGMSTSITLNGLAVLPLLLAGNEQQKRTYLGRLVKGEMAAYCLSEAAAGSDVVGIQTRAQREGDTYVLNGSKTFITNASVANWFSVFAYTTPEAKYKGMSVFVVDRQTPGVTVAKPFDKMGQRASDTAEVIFENVRIPAANLIGKEGEGFMIAMQVFDRSRVPTAAGAVGVARRALDESMRFARQRQTMGKPIWQHQAVGHIIADMAMHIDAARLLVWQAAAACDRDQPDPMKSAFAKAFAADIAMKVCTDAVQVFGGYGFIEEYPVAKLMRDVKIFQIYEGTSQIQRNIIARELFRE
ncbi:MAG: acyl-CoA dehydrogenase family protein [candidate division KSB1 bacterium]|nr:acyl-CoA dehydrogenase family protein [candidate division KSB1 bacterium]